MMCCLCADLGVILAFISLVANKDQNIPLVNAQTIRYASTCIILYTIKPPIKDAL